MDDFFNQVLNDLDTITQKILRRRYLHIHDIMMSKDINYILGGNDINALISYIKLLFEKGGDSTKIKGPLGDKFFLETDDEFKDLNNYTKNVHGENKYVDASEIKNISPSVFQDTKNEQYQNYQTYQRYFANISEKEYNLSDISACIYLLSLILLLTFGISRCKKCKKF